MGNGQFTVVSGLRRHLAGVAEKATARDSFPGPSGDLEPPERGSAVGRLDRAERGRLALALVQAAVFYHQQDVKREDDRRWSDRQVTAQASIDPAALETQSPDGAFRTKANIDLAEWTNAQVVHL